MRKIFALLLAVSFSPVAHGDDFVSATCQVKLLKVTTDALTENMPAKARLASYFGQVTFNYGIQGKPRTVFFGPHKEASNKRCLVQVYTTVDGSKDEDGCPRYTYSHIDSNCE